jgi:hypothetical protein
MPAPAGMTMSEIIRGSLALPGMARAFPDRHFYPLLPVHTFH